MRLFVAVDPAPAVQAALARTIDERRGEAPDAKWVRPEGIHLTLAFLGHVPEDRLGPIERALRRVASRHRPLHVAARGGGAFGGSRRPRVLWIGIEGDVPALSALRDDVEEALIPHGYEPERRSFSPHLTLARAREPRGDERLARVAESLRDAELGAFRVGELILYRSDLSPKGATYTALARIPLA